MFIMHVALGGCLKAPPVRYGVTEDTGGHITYVLGAAEAMAARSDVDRVEVVTRAFDEPELGEIHAEHRERFTDKCDIVRLWTNHRGYLSKEALEAELPFFTDALVEYVASLDEKPDVIHAHFADAAEAAFAVRSRFGCKVVYTPHSLAIDKLHACGAPGTELRERIERERAALEGADATVVSSRDEAERQVADYGPEAALNVHRIQPGVTPPDGSDENLAKARELLAPFLREPEKPLLLAIARPVAKKNLIGAVEAFAATEGLREQCNLAVLAGLREGPDEGEPEQCEVIQELLFAMDRHDLYGCLALPRTHDRAEAAGCYRLAAELKGAFVNAAFAEPFGLTIIEAASVGLPVVATRVGGPIDVVGTLKNGILVDPSDHEEIGAAMSRITGDRSLWSRYSRSGLENVKAFSWTAYAAAFVKLGRLLTRPAKPIVMAERRRILVSDIDNTLTGSHHAARSFRRWASRREIPFFVATGRSLTEARRVLAEWALPEPDGFITSVGTEIYRLGRDGRLSRDHGFSDIIGANWRGEDIRRLLEELEGEDGLRPQPPIEQREFKCSYFGGAEAARTIRRALREEGLEARVVHSHERLIDVIPMRAGKAAAAHRVATTYGLDLGHVISAGDSGNDIDMLEASGRAIIVAGASSELDSLRRTERLYRARRKYAEGVLEGLDWAGLAG